MNGLPVMPTPMISPAAASFSTWSSAASRLASDCGPKVVGLVWSKPLSRVISAKRPGTRQVQVAHVRLRDDLAGEQLGRALQQLCGAHLPLPSLCLSSEPQCGFSQMTVPPMPKPTHMVVMP